MKLDNLPASITEWSSVPASVQLGKPGTATVRARQFGEIKLRLVEYSPGYIAGHWCHKGHIVFAVAGQLVIEHQHGSRFTLQAGTSYCVADDDDAPHRVISEGGATVFIID